MSHFQPEIKAFFEKIPSIVAPINPQESFQKKREDKINEKVQTYKKQKKIDIFLENVENAPNTLSTGAKLKGSRTVFNPNKYPFNATFKSEPPKAEVKIEKESIVNEHLNTIAPIFGSPNKESSNSPFSPFTSAHNPHSMYTRETKVRNEFNSILNETNTMANSEKRIYSFNCKCGNTLCNSDWREISFGKSYFLQLSDYLRTMNPQNQTASSSAILFDHSEVDWANGAIYKFLNGRREDKWIAKDGMVFSNLFCKSCKQLIGMHVLASSLENFEMNGKIVLSPLVVFRKE